MPVKGLRFSMSRQDFVQNAYVVLHQNHELQSLPDVVDMHFAVIDPHTVVVTTVGNLKEMLYQ